MPITIRTFSNSETMDYRCRKYEEFKKLFFTTTLNITEIWKRLDLNPSDATARYIRDHMKMDGIDSWKRKCLIMTGERI